MKHYKDKDTEFAAYRMVLVAVNVLTAMIIVLLTAAIFPQINAYVMCAVCLVISVATLVIQLRLDHTLIFTGQFLIEDGEALYAVIGLFGFGMGRRHHRNKRIKSYRYYLFEKVNRIDELPFGVRVNATVMTSTSSKLDATKEIFRTPGAMKKLLMEKGRRRRVVFRIENNLLESEKERLLKRLREMS